MTIDFRQHIGDEQQALKIAIDGALAGTWTALPGIIQSFSATAITAVVRPAVKGTLLARDGSSQFVNLPLLLDVPVVFPRGGGCTLTFPVASGDECLVVFASRCIDAWWQQGGVQPPMEQRMHDLSDGFAILGPFSQAQKISGLSTSAVQLRSNDGQAYIQLNPSTHEIDAVTLGNMAINAGGNLTATVGGSANITAASISLTASTISLNGVIGLNGPVTQTNTSAGSGATMQGPLHVIGNVKSDADVTASGTSLHGHTHGGVQPGSGNTAAPN